MQKKPLLFKALISALPMLIMSSVYAGAPLWTFQPLTATTISLPSNNTATVQYRVTNQSLKPHTLVMQPIQGITQTTTGSGICGNPFVLGGKTSCTLSLQINGGEIPSSISDGPIVCQQGSLNQCYRPSSANILRITQTSPAAEATISVSGSPLTLTTNGSAAALTIFNTSSTVTATNITSNFTGTALQGNVTESGNTCASVAPNSSCTLTYTPGGTAVAQTNFPIQGSNTNTITAAIAIETGNTVSIVDPDSGTASGGTGVTLMGTGFTDASAVTFGGVAATSVTVVNPTTITAVTPAHAAGSVDVVVTIPSGDATAVNGYTYLTTAVGQATRGGVIGCLGGGNQDLIAATVDNSSAIVWGGSGTLVGASSNTDGSANTALIVSVLGANGGTPYAAQLCANYEVDSQGNTPCESGNTCYNSWYLPALNQLSCLYTNRGAIGGFNLTSVYWTSTELNPGFSQAIDFVTGLSGGLNKGLTIPVRCVQSFTP